MPNRANSLVPALFAGSLFASSLATTALLGVNVTAEAAECLESPHGTAEPGHWYYHSERAQNRRCWFFQPAEARSAEAMANPQTAPVQAAPSDSTPPSLLSQLTAGFSRGAPSSPPAQSAPQPNTVPNDPAEVAKTASPRPPKATKVSRRPRPQDNTPAPATNGAASAEQHDQSQQPAEAKGEKPQQPSDVVERETLFQDFMKWQQQRAVFGTRWP
jgi:hypothetical protein